MEKIKIGIIGAGTIARVHMDAYRKDERVELYAIYDRNEERANRAAAQFGIRHVFTDLDKMVALPELSAVSVCLCNAMHASATIAALNAGKHVLCEKPMALHAREAESMQSAATRAEKLLMVGFTRRFGEDCAILKEWIDHGDLGEIYYARATYLRRNGNPGGWFQTKALSGGGPLIDLGVHVIDLISYLAGSPKAVSVYGATFQKLSNSPDVRDRAAYQSAGQETLCDVEDMATALIRFDSGMVLSVEVSFCLNIKEDASSVELFGTKAGAKLGSGLEIYTDQHHRLVNTQLAAPPAQELCALMEKEIRHFIDCIASGAECISPAADGVQMMRILDAIYESARCGHEVLLSECEDDRKRGEEQ